MSRKLSSKYSDYKKDDKTKKVKIIKSSEPGSLSNSDILQAITGHTPVSKDLDSVQSKTEQIKIDSTNNIIIDSKENSFPSNKDEEESFEEPKQKVSYSEVASKDVDTIGREITSLLLMKESYEHILSVSKTKVQKIESNERKELFKGELENSKIEISMNTKNLADVEKQLAEARARYHDMKSGKDASNSNKMDTGEVSDNWFNQLFLINEKEEKFVLPFEHAEKSCIQEFSQSFLHLLNISSDKFASEVRYHTLEKKDYDVKIITLLAKYVDCFSKLLTGHYIDGKIPDDDYVDFLNMISKKVLTDLRLDNFSRKKQKMEKKNFYIYLCLPKMNHITEANSQLIVDRSFAFFQRILERLDERKKIFIYETIRKQKKLRFTSYSKEQIRNVMFVDSLRTYRKFILQTEWSTVLNVFHPDKDIALENKIVSGISQRDLKVVLERESHNSFYRKNNIDNVIAFLNIRSRELKDLFPTPQKSKKNQGNPPLLEDVLKDNKLDPLDKIYRLDPLGLIFARFGFNSSRSPIKTNVLWDPQNGNYSLTEQDVQKLYATFHGILSDNERRKSSVNSVQEFSELLLKTLPVAQRITIDLLNRTKF